MTALKKILLVEDDALIAAGLKQVLEGFGYAVEDAVATGEGAIIRAKEVHPDAIIMDIQLAGKMNGIEAAEIISRTQDIPVVYLTAYSDDERLRSAMITEPYAYLVKPVQNQELRTTIQVTLYKHRLDRALRESEARYRAIITQAMEGVVLFDQSTRRIIETNPAFRDLTGYTQEELTAMRISDLMVSSAEITAFLSPKGGCEQCRLGDRKFLRKDHTVLDVECNSSLIHMDGRDVIVCVIAHDVTERKKAETALSEANRKLNLMGSVTRHDLLNQLMALRSYILLSEKYIQDPEVVNFINKEEAILAVMERQITFTRDYQDLGMKKPVWQNVAESVNRAVAALPAQALRIDAGPRDLELYVDPLFEKVFYNLIDNALRYGGDSLSTLTVTSRETENGLVLIFADDGQGIADADRDRLFTKGFGKNTGLGLFLSREILSITGIQITEKGTFGTGARFEISVPKGGYRFTDRVK